MVRKTFYIERDRAIAAARDAGVGYEQLASAYNLRPDSVREIVRIERLRRAYSAESVYREYRGAGA